MKFFGNSSSVSHQSAEHPIRRSLRLTRCRSRIHTRQIGRSAVLALLVTAAFTESSRSDDRIRFNQVVRPLLSDRCIACHGPDEHDRQADLRLDERESAVADRGGYQVVVPGNTEESELWARVTSDDPDLMMPPPNSGKSLSAEEKDTLRHWIDAGAEWEPHWAFVNPVDSEAPDSLPQQPDAHWIDRYLQPRLDEAGISISPPADRQLLIRRIAFDLTGLPPDERILAEWNDAATPAAEQAVIEQLLASDAAAERMATFWLDLVRYADTVGYHGDQDHNISPYRDWVIDAYAMNLPFDQFTREQLAGDLFPEPTVDQKIASGYNRLLQTTHEGGLQPKEYLAIYAADRIRNVSAVWMGATVGCAQCHDHKFDPYTARDFYALGAFFADIDEEKHFSQGTNSLPTRRPPEISVLTRRQRERLAELQQELSELSGCEEPSSREDTAKIERLTEAIEDLQAQARLTMITERVSPRTMRVLPRGNWLDETGPVVEPAVPQFLAATLATPAGRRLNRMDLANWLTDADSGVGLLTARVMVNRYWALLFGTGLSRTPEDFGGQGQPPTHPELLDRLAWEYVRSGWDLRHVIREILNSAAYRRASVATPEQRMTDPENRLYARQNTWRLPAEMVRDNILSAAGLLDRSFGGPPVKPWQPPGYYRHLNFPTRRYTPHADNRQWRRSVYMHWQRQFLHPMMKSLDAPTREECSAARPRSTTPLAALVLLNDPSCVEAARTLGGRLLAVAGPSDGANEAIRQGFRAVTSRGPADPELEVLRQFFTDQQMYYAAHPDDAKSLTTSSLRENAASSANITDAAAWIMTARLLLNLDEAITRP